MKTRGLNAFHLKIIALIFMVLDHLYSHLFYQIWPEWVGLLTRFVAPLFLYLMVEGYYHTRNKKKYAQRLFIAAAVMMAGNVAINLFFHNTEALTGKMTFWSLIDGHNIFLTLGLLFMIIWCLDKIQLKEGHLFLNILGLLIFGFLSLWTEGGFYLLPLAVIFKLCYQKMGKICLFTALFCLLLLVEAFLPFVTGSASGSLYSALCFDSEWAMVTVLPFILSYNGQRGRNSLATKYMFYVIYPLHLWLLMILRFLIMK
ncbi:TraX family protein [Streptococcus orisasini]|uniref:TraX family protein n=1 Tax=Streptococcus orisasini TaxID=1080071 RepID=UPI000708F54F|nr:TraX family protein [Streptococcus orisasini]